MPRLKGIETLMPPEKFDEPTANPVLKILQGVENRTLYGVRWARPLSFVVAQFARFGRRPVCRCHRQVNRLTTTLKN